MPALTDIFDSPTEFQRMLGRDMSMLGGFAIDASLFGQFNEANPGKVQFMGGAGQHFKTAGKLAKFAKRSSGAARGALAKEAGKFALKGASRAAFPIAGIGFMASGAVQGFKDGGIVGAGVGMAKEAAVTAAWSIAGRGAFSLAANPFILAGAATAAVAGGAAYGLYKGAEASWKYHYKSLPLETAGSTAAFSTAGAATMRQRSMKNIQRSHLNARSAFGNEAQWAHIARYRGINTRRGMGAWTP